MYERNQRQNAPQEDSTSSNLTDAGWVAARVRGSSPATLRLVDVASREATVKVCGVTVAKLQGHSWAPNPSSGSRMNVGTTPVVPSPARLLAGGKARGRLTLSEWDGGVVVVRGRESRPHGEGPQRVRSIKAEDGVRR